MRKILRSITDLSLFQQLSIIVFVVAFTLIGFFNVYLQGNIEDFIKAQTMNLLQRSQQSVIATYQDQNGYSGITYEADVMHFIYRDGIYYKYVSQQEFSRKMLQQVDEEIKHIDTDWAEDTFKTDQTYYYLMNKIDDRTKIISVVSESYGAAIENSLMSSFSNTCFIVVSIMFIILFFWVSTILLPLQQIRIYIEKLRRGDENAKLVVNRKDEIGEMASALVALQDELKRQQESKEEMVHNISHDLKTPIATIKSYAESIKDGIYPYETLEKSVDVIIENSERLEKKVYSLLFLNRLDYMKDQERDTDKVCNMKDTVDEVMRSLKLIRPEVEIRTQIQDAMFKGEAESWRIVLENLVDNALRYAETYVEIVVQPDELTVSNDGKGISEERMARLFKPFEKGTKGKFGLGLSICYKVCSTYNYTITAENTEDGVSFIIKNNEKPARKRIFSKNQ